MRRIDTKTLPSNEILVFTDFSASPDLRAKMTNNCSADAHAVLDIFVILHSRRKLSVEKEGAMVSTLVYNCDVWYFFGSTLSKGKKNNHVFHNSCLDHIVHHYNRKIPNLSRVGVWTDNCAGQYKCRQNFFKAVLFPARVAGISVTHKFSQKYHFKGVWDAAGKVIKAQMRKLELQDVRLPTALECF
jgi:hypothetical protein